MKNIPIFVPHYGCPNQCIFCNQNKISGTSASPDFATCEDILKQSIVWNQKRTDTEIAFFGGSFTGIPMEHQKRYLEIANRYLPYVNGIRISTRPDYISDEILEFLLGYGVTTIELGVQSMSDEVLAKNRRGMTKQDVVTAVRRIRSYPVSLGLQMMVSMYASSREEDLRTAREIIALQPDFVRIYPTVVLEDTKLYELYRKGEYPLASLEDTVHLVADIYRRFYHANILVIRVGLMSSAQIQSHKVIGAYHEAFGELVQNEIYYSVLEQKLQHQATYGKALEIHCGRGAMSQVIGHKRRNIDKLKEAYGLCLVNVSEDSSLSASCYEIRIDVRE